MGLSGKRQASLKSAQRFLWRVITVFRESTRKQRGRSTRERITHRLFSLHRSHHFIGDHFDELFLIDAPRL